MERTGTSASAEPQRDLYYLPNDPTYHILLICGVLDSKIEEINKKLERVGAAR